MLPDKSVGPDPQDQQAAPDESSAGLNLEELARKVFELLLRELQIENDRTGK